MKSGKRVVCILVVSLLLIISISFVSAALKDWFGFGDKDENLKGELPNAAARLKISDMSPPDVIYVSNVTGSGPISNPNFVKLISKGTDTLVSFFFLAQQGGSHDQPGALANYATTTGIVNLTRPGEIGRNATCTAVGTIICTSDMCPVIPGTAVNYSCVVPMKYYDENGTWNINASVRAPDTPWGSNNTRNFTILATFAAYAHTTYLNWTNPPLTTAAVDAFSNNNITVENNGNVPYPNVLVNATNLNGTTTPSEYIPSNRFVANNCTGTPASAPLTKDADIPVNRFIAPRARTDAGMNSSLPFCVTSLSGLGSLSNQEYIGSRQWILTLLTT